MGSSLDDRPLFDALLGLLPPERREEPAEAWDIGEQEGALGDLVDALVETRAAVSDLDRARFAVLAETWGCWDGLSDPLAACARDDREAGPVAVIEDSDEGRELTRELADGNLWPGHTAVAWIVCRHCDDVLVRVHETVPWGLSVICSAYAIVRAGQIHASFDSGTTALAALVETRS